TYTRDPRSPKVTRTSGTPSLSTAPITSASSSASLRIWTCSSSAGSKSALRSEEHTSELQSRGHLVCRLLLEKKNKTYCTMRTQTKTLKASIFTTYKHSH